MTGTEKSRKLMGCVNMLGNMRVPVALTEDIIVPVQAVMHTLEDIAQEILDEARQASQDEHEEART